MRAQGGTPVTSRRTAALALLVYAAFQRDAFAQTCNATTCLSSLPAGNFITNQVFRTRNGLTGFALDQMGLLGTLVHGNSICNGHSNCSAVGGFQPGVTACAGLAFTCDEGCPTSDSDFAEQVRRTAHLDYRYTNPARFNPATSPSVCGGGMVADGNTMFFTPKDGAIFDLHGEVNRVALFPITDHGPLPCEAFEYAVYLTDNPNPAQVTQVITRADIAAGVLPDPMKWNEAELFKAWIGWDPANGETAPDPNNPNRPDGYATEWKLPCGIAFRYVSLIAGNQGNPSAQCAFASYDAEIDAVVGLNEDDTAVCPDRDGDGHRAASCGGDDCCDAGNEAYPGCTVQTAPTIYPGAPTFCGDTIARDCSGMIPQCPTGQNCVNNTCVFACGPNNGCPAGFSCQNGNCLPANCGGTPCPPGQVCQNGNCVDACTGAMCPAGQVCRGGTCVDPCTGVGCPPGQVCVSGMCAPGCQCTGCPTNQSCAPTDRCVATPCTMMTCPPGQICNPSGNCTDACSGVTCPLGQRCIAGTCTPDRCFGVNCPIGQRCQNGTCIDACTGVACPPGQMCQGGQCVDPCTGVTCPSGQTCVGGDCVAMCGGMNCQPGEICVGGQCMPRPRDAAVPDAAIPDAASTDAPVIDAPVNAIDAPLGTGGAGGGSGGAAGGTGGASGSGGTNGAGAQDAGGCGCSVAARPPVSPWMLLFLLPLLRRRRS
jgi:hypothetical protein